MMNIADNIKRIREAMAQERATLWDDIRKRLNVAHGFPPDHDPYAPVQPEATAHKTSEGEYGIPVSLGFPTEPQRTSAALSQPAPVGAEAPERVTMLQKINGLGQGVEWMHEETPGFYGPKFRRAAYVRADVHEKAVDALRALVNVGPGTTIPAWRAAVALISAHDVAAGRK